VQAALLCGIGLQSKSVDELVSELNLPGNQVLAMFNKGIRKISLALQVVIEEAEKEEMFGGDESRKALVKAEAGLKRMEGVSVKTLDEEDEEGVAEAMDILNGKKEANSGANIDSELMRYSIKGTNEQWDAAMKSKAEGGGNIQIKAKVMTPTNKRPIDFEAEDEATRKKRVGETTAKSSTKKEKTQKSEKKQRRKEGAE
jgi:N-acetyltransferase 10